MNRTTAIFAALTVTACILLLTSGHGFIAGLVAAVVPFTILWLISLALKDASIVDMFWGPGFILVGCSYAATVPGGPTPRGVLVLALVTVWGLRLALHIGIRNAGSGEDFRYRKWRTEADRSFWWISYFKVFLLQAVMLWIASSPLLLAQLDETTEVRAADCLGLALWIFGFLFETVADRQLRNFKKNPANSGRVMRSGLWSLSRHPNYFGETVLWWGIGLLALPGDGWLSLVGPVIITFLLLKVSGVTLLDAALEERRPGYADYMATTPAFVPLPRCLRGSRNHSSKESR
jgi:steroid 5-alpha reductase family enzyme